MDQIVTFDVWDTLLRRKCHPDEIRVFSWERFKMLQGKYLEMENSSNLLQERQKVELMIAEENQSVGFDDEYLIDKVFFSLEGQVLENQIEFEIFLEIQNSFKSRAINKHISALDLNRTICISDFYMSSEQLRKIIVKHYPNFLNVQIVTSADVNLNKRSGRLFEYLSLQNPWVHIGDNPVSDFMQSKKRGAKGILYRPLLEQMKKKSFEKRFKNRDLLVSRVGGELETNMKIAIGLVGFCAWISSSSKGTLVFLEREGIFLQRVYEYLETGNPWDLEAKKNVLISVSRIATVNAAFHVNPTGVLERLLKQYGNIDLPRLSRTLGIPEEIFPHEFSSLTGLELVTKISIDDKLMSLLLEHTKQPFENTLSYLKQNLDTKDITCVDLGWSGTIQDNLADILGPENNVSGRYLAMRPNSITIPLKSGFLNKHSNSVEFQKIMRALRPVEMLFNSKLGSTLSYEIRANKTEVIRSKIEDSFPPSFSNQQEEIYSKLAEAVTYIRENLLTLSECSHLGLMGISEIVTKPSGPMLKDYLNSIHDETYGLALQVHPGRVSLSPRDLIRLIKGDTSKLRTIYWHVGWPEALAKSTLGFIPSRGFMSLFSKIAWSRKFH
jgi:FMN phosphatase YigB (HAD superfamily)